MINKKVLFLVNHDVVIYNFRLELVERLLQEGCKVIISSPYGERIDELTKIGCSFIDTPIDRHGINPIHDLKLITKYKKIIKAERPDIIFSYTIKPNIYGAIAAQKEKVPVVANITGLGTAVENSGFLQKITIILYKFAFRDIQKVFFQNKENQQFFIDHKIAIGKQGLLPGSGVNLTHFSPLPYPPDGVIHFAFISRIMKEKGIDLYLEAAEKIKQEYPNTVFHVCGFCEQNYEDKLKNYQQRGIIVYHGMVKDVRTILSQVHCVVHPSYYPEGMSNVLLEACACGRPVISTNRSGCREVIVNRVNGFLIKEKDILDLTKSIKVFLGMTNNEQKQMGLEGRQKVEREFDRNIVIDKYLKEIDVL